MALRIHAVLALVLLAATAGAQTALVQDIHAAGSSHPQGAVWMDGVLYFSADDGVSGVELWRSTGTTSGTYRVADICPGACASSPQSLTAFQGTLYFAANDGTTGVELWKSDGTAAGTVLVKDLNATSGSSPHDLTPIGSRLYFLSGCVLSTDGTAAGTAVEPPCSPGVVTALSSAGNAPAYVFFPLHASSPRLVGGTPPHVIQSSILGDVIDKLTPVNGLLYYRYQPAVVGFPTDLSVTDGTTRTVLATFSGIGSLDKLTRVGSRLFFTAMTATGKELWVTDGTIAGTVAVADINAGPASSNPDNLTDVNGTLYFTADDGANGRELWKSDGTAAGTTIVSDIVPGPGASAPAGLRAGGSSVYFSADDGVNGSELWTSDGTALGTRMVQDIEPGPAGGPVPLLVGTPAGLFFSPFTSTIGYELWLLRSDKVPVYRLYSTVTNEHLLSTDPEEYFQLGFASWTREGLTFRLLPTNATYNGATPTELYRLYHSGIHQHLWTSSALEYSVLPGSGWTQEGVIGYLLPAPQAGTVPLRRLALASPPLHLWTISAVEYSALEAAGWSGEGTLGHVFP